MKAENSELEMAKAHYRESVRWSWDVIYRLRAERASKADAFVSGHQEREGYMELVLHAKRGKSLPFTSFLSDTFLRHEISGRYALSEDGKKFFEYDDVKAVTKVGETSRTISASQPTRIRSYHDVSDRVEMGKDGHPTYDSIHAEAIKHAANISKQIYGEEV